MEQFDQWPRPEEKIVYVKMVDVSDLPEDVRDSAGEHDVLCSVHDSEGQRLALVADRKLAFVLAREYGMQPVTVH